jgi:hypothetical protein
MLVPFLKILLFVSWHIQFSDVKGKTTMETQQLGVANASIRVRALRLRTHIQHQLFHSNTPEGIEKLVANYFNYWQQRKSCDKVVDVWKGFTDNTPWQDFSDVW